MTTTIEHNTTDYQRIATAIAYIEENFRRQPEIDEVAAAVHLSRYHFQRLFKRWAGVTPLQFMHYLTLDYAKERLQQAHSVYDTALDAGLSSAGRLHDLFVTFEALTPGEYKQQGAGLLIRSGVHPTPFGDCLIAVTDRGICALRFVNPHSADQLRLTLQQEWPQATFVDDRPATAPLAERLFTAAADRPFHLLLKGTNFQVQVWQALLQIPPGEIVAYGDVARFLGRPSTTRAVASAIARNPIGYLIPCHRVIRQNGSSHNYRWGGVRKKALLAWEASHAQSAAH